jgi:tetratricopeptide (TPR) repeat protein
VTPLRTVATTWLVSEQQLSLTARAILQIAAFLAPDDIPRLMFAQGGKVISEAAKILEDVSLPTPHPASPPSPHPMGRGQGEGNSEQVEDALAELAGHSLVELETETFSCHRLLQTALLDRLKKEDRQRWAEITLKLVNEFAPANPSDVRTWPVWDVLSQHAFAILKELWEQINPDASRLMNELGQLLDAKALYAEAEPPMRRALAIDEKSFGPEHPRVAIRLNNLALLLQATNRLGEAEPLMRRALAIDEKSFGPEHPNVAIRLNNLAQLLKATNRLGEAEPLMRRHLLIFKEFNQATRHQHPHWHAVLSNYRELLAAMKLNQKQIEAKLREVLGD